MNYTSWVSDLSTILVIDSDNAAFQAILPACIEYAEGRIYRELAMLVANVRDATAP